MRGHSLQPLVAVLALVHGSSAATTTIIITETVTTVCSFTTQAILPLAGSTTTCTDLPGYASHTTIGGPGSPSIGNPTSIVAPGVIVGPGGSLIGVGTTVLPGGNSNATVIVGPDVTVSPSSIVAPVVTVSDGVNPSSIIAPVVTVSDGVNPSSIVAPVIETGTATGIETGPVALPDSTRTSGSAVISETETGIATNPGPSASGAPSSSLVDATSTGTGVSSSAETSTAEVSSLPATSASSSSSTTAVSSSSTSSSSSTTSPTASPSNAACSDYYLENIQHQGIAPYTGAGYQVFRNVKDYGAKGDGVADDTAAINAAINGQGRCAPGSCGSTTTTPALVYFPPGTYLVSAPIINYYYTQIVGNPGCLPVIKASANFNGRWVIDGDAYQPSGSLGWAAVNTFWRQIRNFELDLTSLPATSPIAALHWPVGQASLLQNIVFRLSTAVNTQHQGLFIEEGSGGMVADLVIYGGAQGLAVGNQQFTMRNLTFYGSQTAIQQLWDWGWTYKGISINNCGVGLDLTAVNEGLLNVGGIVMVDSEIIGTPVGIRYGSASATGPPASNNIMLENIRITAVDVAIEGPGGATVLAGTQDSSIIAAWGRGNQYTPTGPTQLQGPFTPNARSAGLVTGTEYYERSKPQYETVPASEFVSVRTAGAAGNGVTDDTAAINAVLASAAAANKVVFFDAGVYVVTGTVYVPPGSRIVGEAYPIILSSGAYFNDMANPKPVVQVGRPGELGLVEWSDMVVSSRGGQAGAILIEWNLASAGTLSGMWDVHTRVGGFAGSDLQVLECPKTPNTTVTMANLPANCIAAFMSMHITPSASGLYMENVWLWVADHDIEDPALTQITIYAGRGLLVESTVGNIWMYGTSVEHHVLYEYQFVDTTNIVAGQIQTETAYYQPNPDATIPFPAVAAYHDPVLAAGASGWGLRVVDSSEVLIYGAGLYSFFTNNNVTCSNQGNGAACQSRMMSVERSTVSLYNLNTVGVTNMITVDGVDVARYSDNLDGFVQSIALFRS